MKVAVVYESMYGNTQRIARAIADGLRTRHDVVMSEVGKTPASVLNGLDLLVIGGPTHVWSMSSKMSRRGARQQAKTTSTIISETIGVREWLKARPNLSGLKVAAFDTGIPQKGWFPTGSAAIPIATLLRRKHAQLIAEPERFNVVGTEGPLVDGEVERAERWAADVGRRAEDSRAGEVPFDEPVGHPTLNLALGAVLVFVGLSAVAGSIGFLADTSGAAMGLSTDDLEDTPFDSYLIPALLLLLIVGGSALAAGAALLLRVPKGPEMAVIAGAILIGWIAVQMTMIQFYWLQPLFLVIGLLIVTGGWAAKVLRGT